MTADRHTNNILWSMGGLRPSEAYGLVETFMFRKLQQPYEG